MSKTTCFVGRKRDTSGRWSVVFMQADLGVAIGLSPESALEVARALAFGDKDSHPIVQKRAGVIYAAVGENGSKWVAQQLAEMAEIAFIQNQTVLGPVNIQ